MKDNQWREREGEERGGGARFHHIYVTRDSLNELNWIEMWLTFDPVGGVPLIVCRGGGGEVWIKWNVASKTIELKKMDKWKKKSNNNEMKLNLEKKNVFFVS